MSFDAKAFLASLTELPGVYRMLDANENVLYVVRPRISKSALVHISRKSVQSSHRAYVSQIANIATTPTRTEAEALLLENNLIKSLSPRYNILFRDDKILSLHCFDAWRVPRLGFYRGNPDRKSDYFGPYPSSLAVRDSIHLLQKMFRLVPARSRFFQSIPTMSALSNKKMQWFVC
jgi:excinuclease ABC subunit C